MSDPIASRCLTAQTCALCPPLHPATVSWWQLLGHGTGSAGRLGRQPRQPEPERKTGTKQWPGIEENSITIRWSFHVSRKAAKHFNGHLPTVAASLCWFIQASLHLTWKSICFLNSLFFPASMLAQMTYLLCLLFFLKCPFVSFSPIFHIFQVRVYVLLSVFLEITHMPIDSSSSSRLLVLLLLLLGIS